MQILQDRAYFESRAAKAHSLALAAADPLIRQIHVQRAMRYDELARSANSQLCVQSPQSPATNSLRGS